jgi:hypothetical protein
MKLKARVVTVDNEVYWLKEANLMVDIPLTITLLPVLKDSKAYMLPVHRIKYAQAMEDKDE